MSGLSDRPQQLLREFMRYRNLMARKNISKNLQGERETLLAQLTAYVEQLDNDFETFQSESKAPAGKNMPRVTNIVVWAKQLEAKLQGLPERTGAFAVGAVGAVARWRGWRRAPLPHGGQHRDAAVAAFRTASSLVAHGVALSPARVAHGLDCRPRVTSHRLPLCMASSS